MDAAVEFEKLYEIVEPLYSEEEGRRGTDRYEELADDARYTPEYKGLYAKRKETIFASSRNPEHTYSFTAAFRASARSVFSQATPRSSRPMWP